MGKKYSKRMRECDSFSPHRGARHARCREVALVASMLTPSHALDRASTNTLSARVFFCVLKPVSA